MKKILEFFELQMKRQYSFIDDDYDFGDDEDDRERIFPKKNHEGNVHVPESRHNARSGTIGSFSSITSKYNNIYRK